MPPRLNKGFFTKVTVARQLLRDQAEEILKQYMEVVKQAQDSGDYETAAKALQWLIEHMPSEEDGTRAIDVGVDKQQQQIQKDNRPAIQIGIQVGGVKVLPEKKQEALPEVEVVDGE